MSDTTHNGLLVYTATPLTVEDHGSVRMSGGVEFQKWKIRLDDNTDGTYWGAKGQPCPFQASIPCQYTRVDKSYGIKISPYLVSVEHDNQDRIARMAALNTANALIANGRGEATIENLTGIADKILEWINQK